MREQLEVERSGAGSPSRAESETNAWRPVRRFSYSTTKGKQNEALVGKGCIYYISSSSFLRFVQCV